MCVVGCCHFLINAHWPWIPFFYLVFLLRFSLWASSTQIIRSITFLMWCNCNRFVAKMCVANFIQRDIRLFSIFTVDRQVADDIWCSNYSKRQFFGLFTARKIILLLLFLVLKTNYFYFGRLNSSQLNSHNSRTFP